MKGLYADQSDTEYHSIRNRLSASGARILIRDNPAKFRQWQLHPPIPKAEYTFGHAAHTLVLGKGMDIVEVHAEDWRSKFAREARETAHADGKAPMLSHELAVAQDMAAAVREHPVAGELFSHGQAEVSMFATDPVFGVALKGRVDWITTYEGRPTIVDFKTAVSADPEQFSRKAADYCYHMQGAWYQDLALMCGPTTDARFLFAVVEKHPPYLVSVVEFDTEALTEGKRLNQQAIELFARCVELDEWPGYPECITPISLPPWALSDVELKL